MSKTILARGACSPHGLHVPCGDVGAGDDREIEIAPVLFQEVFDGAIVGRMDDLDAQALVFEIRTKTAMLSGMNVT